MMTIKGFIRQSLHLGAAIFALLSRHTQACTSVESIFAQTVYEVGSNSASIGGYETAGAKSIWSDNPLRDGGLEGKDVGTSSGSCTLLPGAWNWICYGMLKIWGEGTITYAGLSPNSEVTGKFAITGGTGCYEDATGSLYMTSTGDETSEAFTWTYTVEPAGEYCVSLKDLVGSGLMEENTGGETVGDFETSGSMDLWDNNTLMNSNNEKIGESFGECTVLPGAAMFICIGVMILSSGDTITFLGNPPNSVQNGTLAVTGGTGCYAGAGGTFLLAPTNENYTNYMWKYMDPPSAEDCTESLLETLGGDPNLYEKNDGSDVIGHETAAGSFEVWSNNGFYSGSPDGDVVATSFGKCILLPNALEYFCISQTVIDNTVGGNSYVVSGYSPNSNDTGILVINGGTGCFPGLKGQFNMTIMSIDPESMWFLHLLVSTNEGEVATGDTADGTDAGNDTGTDTGESTETDTSTGEEGGGEGERDSDGGTTDSGESDGGVTASGDGNAAHEKDYILVCLISLAVAVLL